MNVKAAIPEKTSLKLIKRDIQNKFNMERLEAIHEQFLHYADGYGQSWVHIPFVYVHLKAAYRAQNQDLALLSRAPPSVSRAIKATQYH